MHIAGQEIIRDGWEHHAEFISPKAKVICERTGANPVNSKTGIELLHLDHPVKMTIMDGDLPGYGIYVFCKTQKDLDAFNLWYA